MVALCRRARRTLERLEAHYFFEDFFSNRGGGGSCGTFLLFYTKQVQNLSFSREAPSGKMK